MTRFGDHFNQEIDESTYGFTLSKLTPSCDRETLVGVLVDVLARAKSDPTVTAELLDAVGWTTAVADLRQGRIAVRRGDFAEAIAAEACEDFDGRLVPVRKLRYQIDPNQTLPGADVVGLVMADESSGIEDLEFVEVKYRTNPPANIAVDAHDQLADDRASGYATTIKFLANRLKESDPELYSDFLTFLSERDVKDSWHTVAISFEATKWSEVIADNLDELEKHLPELWLRILPFENAVALIDEIYAELLWDVIEGD